MKIYIKKNNKDLDKRINIIISVFLLISLLTLSKLLMIGFEKKFYFVDNYFLEDVKRRAIVDQNHNLLAYNIKTHDLLIRTKKVKNLKNLNLKLRSIF